MEQATDSKADEKGQEYYFLFRKDPLQLYEGYLVWSFEFSCRATDIASPPMMAMLVFSPTAF